MIVPELAGNGSALDLIGVAKPGHPTMFANVHEPGSGAPPARSFQQGGDRDSQGWTATYGASAVLFALTEP
jgi:hypothetical protein